MEKISIIIPTLNEEKSIKPLLRKINKAMTGNTIEYEIIFIDDHSSDNTIEEILSQNKNYPIRYKLKKGKKGKAFSILEGLALAKYELVAIIDADLQYSPLEIPGMIRQLRNEKADIVVGNRIDRKEGRLRNIFSKSFKHIFAYLLHGLDMDVQSGLKVFKKKVYLSTNLQPTAWTFDLEFLLQAKLSGYKISSYNIEFSKRNRGVSKVNLLKTTYEIALSAVKLKFTTKSFLYNIESKARKGVTFSHQGKRYHPASTFDIKESAFFNLTGLQKLVIFSLLVIIFLSLILNWHASIIAVISFLTIMYFTDLIFNFFLVTRSFRKKPDINFTENELEKQRDWPNYTIFCPLYKESEVIGQFVDAIKSLDYPQNRLEVLLLLEEDDLETIQKARTMLLPANFKIVVVPDGLPKTKPKACNFGLLKVSGQYSVIYDAEDIPDPKQLKKAVLAFENSGGNLGCVQAKLNFYNPRQNILTRLFTAEYSLWFDLVLTGLQSINAPIPLGGTSNHFKVKDLQELGGWDAFNVTEDCDLGMRLAKKGLNTAIIDSVTLEEATSKMKNWFNQRTRWIKGYIQTYFVHSRTSHYFWGKNRYHHFPAFQLIVGGKVLSMFINPLMWFISISYFTLRPLVGGFIESLYPAPIFYMGVVSMVVGNFMYFYYYMLGLAKRKEYDLVKYVFLIPFYWLLMSGAAWVALYQFIKNPHHWAKTKHGMHLNTDIKLEGIPSFATAKLSSQT